MVLTRGRLADGYGDKVIPLAPPGARKVVLLAAGTPPGIEARIVLLGADCVLRDPVRINVLCEYLAKYMAAADHQPTRSTAPKTFCLAGMTVDVLKRQIHGNDAFVSLTSRELALAQILVEAEGEVVTYEFLYKELLERRFYGDTSNMRVLLGKLNTSGEKAGADMKRWIHVIPKTGYRYQDDGEAPLPGPAAPQQTTPTAAVEALAGKKTGKATPAVIEHVTEKLR